VIHGLKESGTACVPFGKAFACNAALQGGIAGLKRLCHNQVDGGGVAPAFRPALHQNDWINQVIEFAKRNTRLVCGEAVGCEQIAIPRIYPG